VARDGLSFSDASSAVIAALKNPAKHSHTLRIARAIAEFFALLSRHWKRQKTSISESGLMVEVGFMSYSLLL